MIDASAYLGAWPFRRLQCTTVGRLLEGMDGRRIERAVVSCLENVFYKDQLTGNRALYESTRGYADRLIPAYTANPGFPGWETDLEICIEEFGMKVLRLHP